MFLTMVENSLFIVLEILLGEKLAESRVSKCVSLVRAELEHRKYVGTGEVDSLDLGLESGDSGVEGIVGEFASGC